LSVTGITTAGRPTPVVPPDSAVVNVALPAALMVAERVCDTPLEAAAVYDKVFALKIKLFVVPPLTT
jgi:hypothetical protein